MIENKDDWMIEKVGNIIKSLIAMQQYLEDYNQMNELTPWGEKVRDVLNGQILSAYHDLTKLLSRAYGSNNWDVHDRLALTSGGKVGLDSLRVKYSQNVDSGIKKEIL